MILCIVLNLFIEILPQRKILFTGLYICIQKGESVFPNSPPNRTAMQRLADTTSGWNLKLLRRHHQMSHDVQKKENYYILDLGIRKIIKPNYKAMIYLPLI